MIGGYTILIGDDHPLVQAALEGALKQAMPGLNILSAGTLQEVAEVLRSAKDPVDLVLLDLNMPGSTGFIGLLSLQSEFPTTPVAILSAEQDPVTVHSALCYGASGYIPKSMDLPQMLEAIRRILDGEIWTPFPLDSAPHQDDDTPRRFASLSPQQLRILTRLVEGKLNKQIAGELQVAEQTIKVHVSTILRKLGVTTRTQAAILAERLMRRGQ